MPIQHAAFGRRVETISCVTHASWAFTGTGLQRVERLLLETHLRKVQRSKAIIQ